MKFTKEHIILALLMASLLLMIHIIYTIGVYTGIKSTQPPIKKEVMALTQRSQIPALAVQFTF